MCACIPQCQGIHLHIHINVKPLKKLSQLHRLSQARHCQNPPSKLTSCVSCTPWARSTSRFKFDFKPHNEAETNTAAAYILCLSLKVLSKSVHECTVTCTCSVTCTGVAMFICMRMQQLTHAGSPAQVYAMHALPGGQGDQVSEQPWSASTHLLL